MTRTERQRIDKLLVSLGLAETRTKARALVMAGDVLVDERRVDKPSEAYSPDSNIRLKSDSRESRYVGRGGIKLEQALREFHICPDAYVCLDVGSSTGGFTDCLLKHGAERVFAVDAGTNQLVWSLRSDPRVRVFENTNARYLDPSDFETGFDLITVDVSFISVTKILGALPPLLKPEGTLIVLVKPQFEVGKGEVGKGGVVSDPAKHRMVIESVTDAAHAEGLFVSDVVESPILGSAGNKEFLMHMKIG